VALVWLTELVGRHLSMVYGVAYWMKPSTGLMPERATWC